MRANQKLEKLFAHFVENIPEYYKGVFIHDKGNPVKGKSEIVIIQGSENILFQSKTYLPNKLNEVMNRLNENFNNPAKNSFSKNLVLASLYEGYKNLVVGLPGNSA